MGGTDAEYEEKLQSLNKKLTEANDKNAKNGFEIVKLKKELKEREEEVSDYINQIDTNKKSIGKIGRQRNIIIASGIAVLAISIVVGGSYYKRVAEEKNIYYNQAASLELEKNTLKNQINSFEDHSELESRILWRLFIQLATLKVVSLASKSSENSRNSVSILELNT
ncbi:MAG: hypothetical protein LBT14_02630, partial [Treponema sp.]|nr:hypothetical protein [Treponema sp.]